MAQYYGYVYVPHGSFDEWRSNTIGNGYDVDYSFGDQCWDYCALLYHQYGLQLITKAGGGGAQDCWIVSRQVNSQLPFESIDGVQNIKRGDIIVMGGVGFGHIAFADEDYNGSVYLRMLGQNQQGNGTGWTVTSEVRSIANFLGIFRNTEWTGTPPPPPTTKKKKKREFPWVVAWKHWYNKR